MKVQTLQDGFRLGRDREPRYFVAHLAPGPENPEGFPFEIQILDEDGRAGAVVLFHEDKDFVAPGFDVPEPVFRAAIRQPLGVGDYVDSQGKAMMPF